MKFVAISDTHGQHQYVQLPKGDVLIHAGDISKRGTELEIKEFLDWFKELDFEHKIFIAGNHDFYFEKSDTLQIKKLLPKNVIYLQDKSVKIGNVKIWGSPITPWFYNWAFNRNRGEEIRQYWNQIPIDTDIIITHGPALSILDKTIYGQLVGCADLLEIVQEIRPKFHICGHIHEAYGTLKMDETTFINCSVLDVKYRLQNAPIVFEI